MTAGLDGGVHGTFLSKSVSLGINKKDNTSNLRTKEDFKDELMKYYLGNSVAIQTLPRDNLDEEDEEPFAFWQWNYWYAFKNPDAQKKDSYMDIEKAFDQINTIFKPNEYNNEIEMIRWKSMLLFALI